MKSPNSSCGESSGTTGNHRRSSNDHNRLLPFANMGRIMKRSLPSSAKISKEAKETVQECVSEFISFITAFTGEAADKCHREKRKTVNGDDLLWAMTTLGFENYVRPLMSYLSKYRDGEDDGEKGSIQVNDHQHREVEYPAAQPSTSILGFNGGGIYPEIGQHGLNISFLVGFGVDRSEDGGGDGEDAKSALSSYLRGVVES